MRRKYQELAPGKLRVAMIIGTLEVGGAEHQLCALARELVARGHDVRVFAQSGGGPLSTSLIEAGVPYSLYSFKGFGGFHRSLMGMYRDIRPLLQLWRDLWRWKPDVCQAFLYQAYLWNMFGAYLVGIPVRIACRRALSLRASSGLGRTLEWLSKRCTTVVLANSNAVARSAHEVEGIAFTKLRVIYNGVALPEFASETAELGRTPPVGLMVANLIHYKGHADLIEALRSIPEPPRIRLVGDGPERLTLEALAQRAGLADRLMFEGSRTNAAKLFADVQFAVLASHQEGLPNAVLEAMAHGVPIVATAVGGVPELVEHEVCGLLVPPHDPIALRDAIVRMAGDPRLRVRLGRAGRERAAQFGWDRCVAAHLELYAELVGRRGGHRRRLVITERLRGQPSLSSSPAQPGTSTDSLLSSDQSDA